MTKLTNNKGVGKNAPKLVFVGDKWNNKGTYNENTNPNGYFFGQQPSIIRKYIMNHLDGRQGNLIKLMWFLLSTGEGFGLAQTTIIEETGIPKQKYYAARDALINMGWLIYEEKDSQGYLAIDYNFIWKQALLSKEEQTKVEDSAAKR